MDRKRAIRLAEQWSDGQVVTLREGEAREYHKLALAALREQDVTDINVGNKWISVEERLPEKNTAVIAASDNGIVFQCLYAYNGWDLWESNEVSITHWMPLPEPPKEGAEG